MPSSTATRKMIEGGILFLKGFLHNPLQVGSMVPSSQTLSDALLQFGDAKKAEKIIEYGPGVGPVTRRIIEIFPNAQDIALVEINEDFRRILVERFGEHEAIRHYLTHLEPSVYPYFGEVDLVVSGLPLSTLPWATVEEVLGQVSAVLRTGGRFSTFVYWHTYRLPRIKRVLQLLHEQYRHVEVTFVGKNIPPAYVIHGIK